MEQESRQQPSLPVQRAFMVQFRPAAAVEQERWHGRVEHVVSGQASQFHSLEEMLTFFAQVLASVSAQSGKNPGR